MSSEIYREAVRMRDELITLQAMGETKVGISVARSLATLVVKLAKESQQKDNVIAELKEVISKEARNAKEISNKD
ncbi:hypothetical protein P8825_15345 [Shouchella clausii]|uniref:hypothetical protein n=1 Tax=Shouchella clausii TaxID=79880 RepID=UPI002DC01A0C|nr:hypothetical protein [Shouchella clausii]MEB5480940.1 hypothetical protein [Shouchella clausii]